MRNLSLATILSFSAMTPMITSNVAFANIKNTHTTHQKELRIGSKSDILSMDPHVIAESLQLDVLGNIYEPLVGQDSSGKLTPILAKYWKQLSPTRWRFHLREGVHFEQGEAFDADDISFNFERARDTNSGTQVFVGSIDQINKINQYTVDFILKRPKDDFPRSLGFWYMISKRWCQRVSCAFAAPSNVNKTGTHISQTSNGTGPYRLVDRRPSSRSVFEVNPGYWSMRKPEYKKVMFSVVNDDEDRAKRLFNNELDIALPFPLAFIKELVSIPSVRIAKQAEARVLYLGFDLSSTELEINEEKQVNPLRDIRVRRAIQLGIDIDRIHHEVMLGFSRKLAILIPAGTVGYNAALDSRIQRDIKRAKDLLLEAGFPNGFQLQLDCSNDRYLNDAQICRAIANDLAEIGINVHTEPTSKTVFFKKIFDKRSHFYLIGAATNSGDGMNIVYPVLGTLGEGGRGELNFGGYSNPRIDQLLDMLSGESSIPKRENLFSEILKIQMQELPQIPLHQQVLPTGLRSNLYVHITAENGLPWKMVRMTSH